MSKPARMQGRSLVDCIRAQYRSDNEDAARLQNSFSTVLSGQDILAIYDRPKAMFAIREGIAIRYRETKDGMRHILAFLLPGDVCNPNPYAVRSFDHVVSAITDVVVEQIPLSQIQTLFANDGAGQTVLWEHVEMEHAGMLARIATLECHDARQRVVQILGDLTCRSLGDRRDRTSLRLPLTQTHLGDAAGLTAVHVNRVLRMLRLQGLIETQRGSVIVLNPDMFCRLAHQPQAIETIAIS
ncbi:Crp/Fnr family transcriptional regulator [Fulvimarina sp. 2208YS6-2-32]|nr:Crp/Fnr family transcriptional regulator [Fulvimarina sp. 2208YS6-2-32]